MERHNQRESCGHIWHFFMYLPRLFKIYISLYLYISINPSICLSMYISDQGGPRKKKIGTVVFNVSLVHKFLIKSTSISKSNSVLHTAVNDTKGYSIFSEQILILLLFFWPSDIRYRNKRSVSGNLFRPGSFGLLRSLSRETVPVSSNSCILLF